MIQRYQLRQGSMKPDLFGPYVKYDEVRSKTMWLIGKIDVWKEFNSKDLRFCEKMNEIQKELNEI